MCLMQAIPYAYLPLASFFTPFLSGQSDVNQFVGSTMPSPLAEDLPKKPRMLYWLVVSKTARFFVFYGPSLS